MQKSLLPNCHPEKPLTLKMSRATKDLIRFFAPIILRVSGLRMTMFGFGNRLRSKGFSLLEVAVVITISAIVILIIAFNFVATHNFRSAAQDRIAVSREARIAMNHMTRVLRFAKTSETITAGLNEISATIESGHLPFITSDANIQYRRTSIDNTIEYTQAGSTIVIAGGGERDVDITYFEGAWDSSQSEFEIKLTAEKGALSVSLQTRIRAIGA